MKPYTVTLSASDFATIESALRSGAFYAKEFAKKGTSGDREKAERIAVAVELAKQQEIQGGFENEDERNAYGLKKIIAECEQWGCD
jgi:hypothetical protein